jgi:hypothetical protein
MSGTVGEKISLAVGIVATVVVTIVAFRLAVPQMKTYRESIGTRDRLRAANEDQAAALAELRRNQERFLTDDEFVIKVARENRKLFPGEILFTFPVPEE